MPSLKKAREQAKTTLCLANLKSIVSGALAYSVEDPHEQAIPVHPLPSDRGYTGHHHPAWTRSRLMSYDHYGTSYSANTLWHGAIANYGPYLRALSRIPRSANTVLFIENCGRFAWHADVDMESKCCSAGSGQGTWSRAMAPAAVKGWHGEIFHFVTAFADGHARVVRMPGRLYPPPVGLELEQVIEEGHQAIPVCTGWNHFVRGHRWQIDTNPATVKPVNPYPDSFPVPVVGPLR